MINAMYLKAVALVAIVMSGIVYKVLKNVGRACEREPAVNEILFYGGRNEQRAKQVGLRNMMCITYVLVHARCSIDVCVPGLTSVTIANCLISAKKKNVNIRVAIHKSEDFTHLQSFAENGIEVKVINVMNAHLAHEFILVDASKDFEGALAVLGSIDYETSRINVNRDSTILTSDREVVRVLKKEFHRIWETSPTS